MIKTTNSELLLATGALRSLVPMNINIKAALQGRKIIAAIDPLVTAYNAELDKLLTLHNVNSEEARLGKMEDGGDLPESFIEEATELLECEVEITVQPISTDDLARSSSADFSMRMLNTLGPFLSE